MKVTMDAASLKQMIRTQYLSWRQSKQDQNQIHRINQALFELFMQVGRDYPALSEREQLNRLVMQRKGCDEAAAYEVMRIAEESYAAWPHARELNLCDVMRYLAVREFQDAQGDASWGVESIAASVRAVVPHQLCPVRLKQPYLVERRKAERSQVD